MDNVGGVARFAPLHQRAVREDGFQVRSGSVQDGLGGRDPHHVRAELVPLAEDADHLLCRRICNRSRAMDGCRNKWGGDRGGVLNSRFHLA